MSLVAAAGLFLASCGTSHRSTSNNAAYGVNVPLSARQNFAMAYPNATNVVWSSYNSTSVPFDWELTDWAPLSSNDYSVTFTMGNSQYQSWYNSNGTLVGTTTLISNYTNLPYAVSTTLHDRYGAYTIDNVQQLTRGNMTAYQIRLKGNDDSKMKLIVDANGNVLKEKNK